MLPTKAAAKAAFDQSPWLQKVFVTSDSIAFILETDAHWHVKSNKIDDKIVTPFTRDEANDVATPEDQGELIGKINATTTIADLHALLPNADGRADVDAAAKAKADELHAVEETAEEQAKTYWWNHIL
jgi:hypothetical protein